VKGRRRVVPSRRSAPRLLSAIPISAPTRKIFLYHVCTTWFLTSKQQRMIRALLLRTDYLHDAERDTLMRSNRFALIFPILLLLLTAAAQPLAAQCEFCDVQPTNCENGIWNTETCRCEHVTPIILDIAGRGFQLTDAAGGVLFDVNADGIKEQIASLAHFNLNINGPCLMLDRR
jgi:hypothetical protein